MPANRDKTGKFKKGESGNPQGRPKVAQEFRERCRDFMDESGVDSLFGIAKDREDKDRFRALELIAAYSWGKPKQGIELETNDFSVNINIKGV